MFLYSRFVVIDDKPEHLRGIKETLDKLRYDCHTKLYEEETVPDWGVLPGLRFMFIDKNLRAGVTMGGGQQSAFAAIVEVIEKLISVESGPYGLILWAEEPDFEAFKTFLFERLSKDKPQLLPVFCEQLRKGDYIDTTNGDVRDPEKLLSDIVAKMGASAQMSALFSWEADVVAAMDAVLKSITDLVHPEKRGSEKFSEELGQIMYRLSEAGAGVGQGQENPRAAINNVLVPILADRITEHDPQGDADNAWKDAVVKHPDKFASVPIQAAVNTAIHVSFAKNTSSVAIKSTDLGAVIKFPFDKVDEALAHCFGISKDILMQDNFFGMSEEDWAKTCLRLVQIGASCDHAQPKKGPLLYLLAIEWPFANKDGSKAPDSRLYAKKSVKSELEWRSPTLMVKDETPGKISVFLNCTLSTARDVAEKWEPVYRLREELISKLTQEYARHISRPGVLNMSPDD